MRKVFIINDSGHDFSKAARFGTLVPLTTGFISKFQPTAMFRVFAEKLESSQAGDFLLQSGPTVMNMIAASVFVAKHGKLNLLLWRQNDNGQEDYICRRMDFSRLKGE